MHVAIKRMVAHFPSLAYELKRHRFSLQIRADRFSCREPEGEILRELLKPGGVAIDVGANVGHYTLALSRIAERVIAFEPVPTTFSILASNVRGRSNVTLLNMAASDAFRTVGMTVPVEHGLENYYLSSIGSGELKVLCMPLDALDLPRVDLLKIDAEGHDMQVLRGARRLIERHRPVVIVESKWEGPPAQWLRGIGYAVRQLPGSPNVIGEAPAVSLAQSLRLA